MQKNVASQKIGAQMVSATDGSAFTSSVTVAVTGDAGTQATGSVGSGACTHEGNGYHTYAPAQAETNYDLIAFTFTGTGAVPATVQVFTRHDANVTHNAGTAITSSSGRQEVNMTHIAGSAVSASTAQLGVNVVNFGGSAGTFSSGRPEVNTTHAAGTAWGSGAITAGVFASDAITAAKLASDVTTELQSGLATASALTTVGTNVSTAVTQTTAANIRAAVGLVTANLDSQLSSLGGTIDGIFEDTGELQADWANGGRLDLILDARASQTSVDDLPTNAELAASQASADDATLAAIAALNNVSLASITTEIADALLNDAHAEPTGVPAANASLGTKLGVLYAMSRNRVDVTATKKTFYDDGGSAEFEQDLSDNGTTFSQSEVNAV